MPAINRDTWLWIVRDPPTCCYMTMKEMLNRITVRNLCAEDFDHAKGHPCAWLSESEARRDASTRLRHWLALRRRWRLNDERTLP